MRKKTSGFILPLLIAVVMTAMCPQRMWAATHYDAGYANTSTTYSSSGIKFTINSMRIYNYQGNNSHFYGDQTVKVTVGSNTHTFYFSNLSSNTDNTNKNFYYEGEGNEDQYKGSGVMTKSTYSKTSNGIAVKAYFSNQKNEQTVSGTNNGGSSNKWCTADLIIEIATQTAAKVSITGKWRDYSDGVNNNAESVSWSFSIPKHTCNSDNSTVADKYLKTAATCTDAAVYYKSCSLCGEKQTGTFTSGSALGHDHSVQSDAEAYLKTAATCTEDAVYYHKCSRCDDKGSTTWTKANSRLGHDHSAQSDAEAYLKTAATCTEDAVYYHKCIRCDDKGSTTWTKANSRLGHDFSVQSDAEIYLKTAATCTADAVYYHKCSRCDAKGSTTWTKKNTTVAHHFDDDHTCTQCHQTANEIVRVVFDSSNKTLTFYCDHIDHSGNGKTVYEGLNTGKSYPAWFTADVRQYAETVTFDQSFAEARPTSCYEWFFEMTLLKTVNDLEYLNTSEVTNMSSMFHNCGSLTSLDLSHFNTANVTTMSMMFCKCQQLASPDLGSFNTANVTDMTSMFHDCQSITSLNLSSFNTANVTNMPHMFYGCSSLTSLRIRDFDMQNVTERFDMFRNSTALKTLTLTSLPYLADGTFNTQFTGEGVTVNYLLDDHSDIYSGTNHLPAATSCNHHFITSDPAEDATCTTAGHYEGTHCSACQAILTGNEVIAALGHDHSEESDAEAYLKTAANCTEDAVYYHKCSRCDDKGTTTWTKTGSALGHTITGGTCTACNHSFMNYTATSEVAPHLPESLLDADGHPLSYTNTFADGQGVYEFAAPLVTIGKSAFEGCTGLTGSLIIPDAVTAIGKSAFKNCTGFTGNLIIPDAVTAIGESAFKNCSNLQSVAFNAVPQVGEDAFLNVNCDKTVTLTEASYIYKGSDNPFPTVQSVTAKCSLVLTGNAVENHPNTTLIHGAPVEDSAVAATCTTAEKNAGTHCSVCEAILTGNEVVPAKGHTPVIDEEIASTCTTEGLTEGSHCSVCNEVLVAQKVIPLHNFDPDTHICSGCHQHVNSFARIVYDGSYKKLTFYCDFKDHIGEGTVYMMNDDRDVNLPEWNEQKGIGQTTWVYFDKSFANARPTNCNTWFFGFEGIYEIKGMEYLNTEDVTDMNNMFWGCKLLNSANFSGFNTAKVTNMANMFTGCKELLTLDLSSFNTSKVEDMMEMFAGCIRLSTLDLSSFNTSKVDDMSRMFSGCTSLTSLTLGNFDMQNTSLYSDIFNNTSALNTLTLTSLPYFADSTFNTKFSGDGVTVNYLLADHSVVYTGENHLPKATSATYNRNIVKDSGKYSFIVPFGIPADEAAALGKFYQYSHHEDGKVYFADISKIDGGDGIVKANTAYFFDPAKDITSITVENPTIDHTAGMADATSPSAPGLYGTYTPIDVPEGAYGYVDIEDVPTFVKAGEGNVLHPFRA